MRTLNVYDSKLFQLKTKHVGNEIRIFFPAAAMNTEQNEQMWDIWLMVGMHDITCSKYYRISYLFSMA